MNGPSHEAGMLPPESRKPVVLFVCTGNAGRSQLAEAYCRRQLGNRAEVHSAGVVPWPALHPVAEELLRAAGFRPADHFPKAASSYRDLPADVVVTIGEPARRLLPARLFDVPVYRHWDIDDPADAPDGDVVDSFHRAEELIRGRLAVLLNELPQPKETSQ